MVSLAAKAVKAYSRRVIKKSPRSPEHLVKHLRRVLDHPPLPVLLPFGVRKQTFAGLGVHGDWVRVKKPTQAVLYVHGGGFIAGVTRTYLNLCGRFAKALQADVYLPAYRIAPEYPFPAALDDVLATYQLMLKSYPASQITIIGDSAGGALALSALLAIRDSGLPLPKCGVAYSPFADLTAPEDGSRRSNERSCSMFTSTMWTVGADLYGRTDADRRNPHASPVFGEYSGLPPLLITVDEGECLRDDAYRVAERARAANVHVTLLCREGLLHVWPIFYPLIPEARQDVK